MDHSQTSQTKSGFLALVSRLLVDEQLPIRFMYKTVPEHLNDTGWRLFTGYEDDAFMQVLHVNMIAVPIEKLIVIDPSLEELLQYNAGTVWERLPDGNQWQQVYDFKIPSDSVAVDISPTLDDYLSPTNMDKNR